MRRDPDELPAGNSGSQACKADDEPATGCTHSQHSGINAREGSLLSAAPGRRANSADAHGCRGEAKGGWEGRGSTRVCLCATQETSHKALQYISLRERKKKKQQAVILHKFAARPRVQASDLLLTRSLCSLNAVYEGEFRGGREKEEEQKEEEQEQETQNHTENTCTYYRNSLSF